MIKLMHARMISVVQMDSQKMGLPGFNAEQSLNNTTHEYFIVERWSRPSGGVVSPQFAFCSSGPCTPIFYCEIPTGCYVAGWIKQVCCSGTKFGRKTCSYVNC
jgi:hypothetical protein